VLGIVFLTQMDFSATNFSAFILRASTLGYWIGRQDETWFISCIIFLYAIFPLYFKLFKTHGIKASLAFIGAGLALILIYALICVFAYNNKNFGGFTILTIARLPIFFIGAVFGHWAKDGCNIELTQKRKILIGSVTAVAIGALIFFMNFLPSSMQTCSLAYLPYLILTPVLCIALAKFFEKWDTVGKIFTVMGLMSLELYLCHIYLYKLFFIFLDYLDKNSACVMILLISLFASYPLYFVNKKFLTKKTNIRIIP